MAKGKKNPPINPGWSEITKSWEPKKKVVRPRE